ncbi:MAG: site-2 protease family protein [Planctomycetota bacterium]
MFGFPIVEFLLLVFGFGFLIFVHELGHFMVAKWVGIRCPQFAIGFGQAIVSWRKGIGFRVGSTEKDYERRAIEELKKRGIRPAASGADTEADPGADGTEDNGPAPSFTGKQLFEVADEMGLGETEYRLNYLPLGGYVKMLGQEDMDPNAKSDDPRAYNNKPIWARACVISAGVVMNIIFGAVFLMTAFSIGVSFPTATIGGVEPGMPAAATYAQGHEGQARYLGLRPGDVITKVNGDPPADFNDVVIATALSKQGSPVELEVQRIGEAEPLTYVMVPKRSRGGERLLSAGFGSGFSLNVVGAKQDTAFSNWASDRESMAVTHVNNKPVSSYAEYVEQVRRDGARGSVQVTITDTMAGSTFDVTTPTLAGLTPTLEGTRHLLGFVPTVRVELVNEGSPAERAGVKRGDILVRIGNRDWPGSLSEVIDTVVAADGGPVQVVVLRDGERIDLGQVKPKKNLLGIGIQPVLDEPTVARLLKDEPAAALDGSDRWMPGARILSIDDQPVSDWQSMQRLLQEKAAQADGPIDLSVTYQLPVKNAPVESGRITLDERSMADLQASSWTLGDADFALALEMQLLKADGLGDAFLIGMDKTKDFILQTYITLLRLIQGDVKIYNLRGPVGIVHVGTSVAQRGFPYLLFFLGLISINLAVINFLPIPVVDGGHMVFLLIEKIKGSPPSPQVQAACLYAGLALIGFVFVTTLFYDVTRLIGL